MTVQYSDNTPATRPVNRGGTGATSGTPYTVACWGTTSTGPMQSIIGVGSDGEVLTSNGVNAFPTFQAAAGNAIYQGVNLLINGDMQIAQRGTSINGTTQGYCLDRWAYQSNSSFTISQVAGPTSGSQRLQFQRNNGATSTLAMNLGQSVVRDKCIGLAGNTVTLSFIAKCGANYSSTSKNLNIAVNTGTGSSDSQALFGSFTGSTAVISQAQPLTTSEVLYTFTSAAVGSTVTQIAVIFSATPIGTAGVSDWFQISDVMLQVANSIGTYQRVGFQNSLLDCQAYYWKTFEVIPGQNQTPQQNNGINTGELMWSASTAAATSNRSPFFAFPRTLRGIPNSITLYSPGAASAQAYDETASAVCTSTSVVNSSERGFNIVTTGNVSTAIGNSLAIHAAADAELS